MKPTRFLALILLSTLAFAQGHEKKKHSVFAVFITARYVWVESMDGDRRSLNFTSRGMTGERVRFSL
jgi:hypothetical protein